MTASGGKASTIYVITGRIAAVICYDRPIMAEYLDITGEVCPMTFVRVKLKLQSMPAGAQLSVRLRAGEPLANVPRALRQEGHTVVAQSEEGDGIHRLEIRKKG